MAVQLYAREEGLNMNILHYIYMDTWDTCKHPLVNKHYIPMNTQACKNELKSLTKNQNKINCALQISYRQRTVNSLGQNWWLWCVHHHCKYRFLSKTDLLSPECKSPGHTKLESGLDIALPVTFIYSQHLLQCFLFHTHPLGPELNLKCSCRGLVRDNAARRSKG